MTTTRTFVLPETFIKTVSKEEMVGGLDMERKQVNKTEVVVSMRI